MAAILLLSGVAACIESAGLNSTPAITWHAGMIGMTPIDGSSGAPWQRTQAVSAVVPYDRVIVLQHMQLAEVGDSHDSYGERQSRCI
jgi:hypothetical protein